jgi:hypothetical protein
MKTPPPTAVITNAEEYARARREVAKLADSKHGSIDEAVRVGLLHAISIWEKQSQSDTNTITSAEPTKDKRGRRHPPE